MYRRRQLGLMNGHLYRQDAQFPINPSEVSNSLLRNMTRRVQVVVDIARMCRQKKQNVLYTMPSSTQCPAAATKAIESMNEQTTRNAVRGEGSSLTSIQAIGSKQ